MRGYFENMWDIICQIYIYRWTFKAASRPTGCDGSVVLLDGYYA